MKYSIYIIIFIQTHLFYEPNHFSVSEMSFLSYEGIWAFRSEDMMPDMKTEWAIYLMYNFLFIICMIFCFSDATLMSWILLPHQQKQNPKLQ